MDEINEVNETDLSIKLIDIYLGVRPIVNIGRRYIIFILVGEVIETL